MAQRDTTGLKPRKVPTQERSKALVEAIRTAATRVLVDQGLEALTVPDLCEVAGVSPGSFYQYFPHKEAVLYDLLRVHATEVTTRMVGVLADGATLPIEDLVRGAVAAFLDAHRAEPGLHAVLGKVVASKAGPGLENDLSVQFEAVLEGLIRQRMEPADPRDPAVLAFVAFRSLESTVHAAVRDRPELLGHPEFERSLCIQLLAVVTPRERPTEPTGDPMPGSLGTD